MTDDTQPRANLKTPWAMPVEQDGITDLRNHLRNRIKDEVIYDDAGAVIAVLGELLTDALLEILTDTSPHVASSKKEVGD